MEKGETHRRRFLRIGAAVATLVPIALASRRVRAAKNDAMRDETMYQDTPDGDKRCANCVQFVPGATAKANGTCKIIPGDTEISPQGYCLEWAKKPEPAKGGQAPGQN